jgi:hypothetical protein
MNMAALINMAVFMSRVHKSAIVVSKKNMRNINKFVLVKKFVKHLIAAIKSRVPLKIRNILTT